MKQLRLVIFLVVCFMCFSTVAYAEIYVSRAGICTGIEDREPIETAESFTDVARLYFFSELKDAGENAQVKHVWYHGNTKVLEVDLLVKGPRWRTWSYKNIYDMKGPWRAEVVDSLGELLHSVSFTVQ